MQFEVLKFVTVLISYQLSIYALLLRYIVLAKLEIHKTLIVLHNTKPSYQTNPAHGQKSIIFDWNLPRITELSKLLSEHCVQLYTPPLAKWRFVECGEHWAGYASYARMADAASG